MSPPSKAVPTKKSLRIWVKNNGPVLQKKKRFTYVYPRTVEAAKDPFICSTGKNKMFFLIAINVFPDSKIIRPDNSDSDTEDEQVIPVEKGSSTQQTKTDIPPRKKVCKKRTEKPMAKTGEAKQSIVVENPVKPHIPKINTSSSDLENATSPARKRSISKIKGSTTLKKTGLKVTNSENKKDCSKLSLSKLKSIQNEKSKDSSISMRNNVELTDTTIINNFQKVIQACSETGLVSFSLAKKPRESRS